MLFRSRRDEITANCAKEAPGAVEPTAKQKENLGKSNEPLINKENSNSLPAANDGKALPQQTAENKTAAKPAEIPPSVPSNPTNASETVDKTTTLPSPVLAKNDVIVSAFKTDACDLSVGVSMTFEDGVSLTGTTPEVFALTIWSAPCPRRCD